MNTITFNANTADSRSIPAITSLQRIEGSQLKGKMIKWIPVAIATISFIAAAYLLPRVCLAVSCTVSVLSIHSVCTGIQYGQPNTIAKIGWISLCLLGSIGLGSFYFLSMHTLQSFWTALTALNVIKMMGSFTLFATGVGYLLPTCLKLIENGYQQLKAIGTTQLMQRIAVFKELFSLKVVVGRIQALVDCILDKVVAFSLYAFPRIAYWFRPSSYDIICYIQELLPFRFHAMALKLRVQQNSEESIQEDVLDLLTRILESGSQSITLEDLLNFMDILDIVLHELTIDQQNRLIDTVYYEYFPKLFALGIQDENDEVLNKWISIESVSRRLDEYVQSFLIDLDHASSSHNNLQGILKDLQQLSSQASAIKKEEGKLQDAISLQSELERIQSHFLKMKSIAMTVRSRWLHFENLNSIFHIHLSHSNNKENTESMSQLLELLKRQELKTHIQNLHSFFFLTQGMETKQAKQKKEQLVEYQHFFQIPGLIKSIRAQLNGLIQSEEDSHEEEDDIDVVLSFSRYGLQSDENKVFWKKVQNILKVKDQSQLLNALANRGLATQADLKRYKIYPDKIQDMNKEEIKRKFLAFLNPSFMNSIMDVSHILSKVAYRCFMSTMVLAPMLTYFRMQLRHLAFMFIGAPFGMGYQLMKMIPSIRSELNKVEKYLKGRSYLYPIVYLISKMSKRRLCLSTPYIEEMQQTFSQANWTKKIRILHHELLITCLTAPLVGSFFIGVEIIEMITLIFNKMKEWIHHGIVSCKQYIKNKIRVINLLQPIS